MANISNDSVDDAQCKHYAQFASHLGRTSFDIIYWLLFVLVILMLFAASWRYGRLVLTTCSLSPSSPSSLVCLHLWSY